MQQACLLQNKGSPVVLQHPCTVSISTQSTATHRPTIFPNASKRDNTWGLCVLSHTDACWSDMLSPQRSSRTLILTGSDPRPLSLYRSLAATIALLESHALVVWHCLYLTDLMLFRCSSLLSNPLVCLVVWWVKIFVG